MQKPVGLALLAVGIVLLILGISASDSVGSEISEFFTGEPTDKAMWLMIGGVAAMALGAGALLFSGKST